MPPDELPPFAVLLRRHRRAAGLSQEALAERARLSPRAIRALETGERAGPYHETVGMLAAALGLDTAARAALEATVDRRRRPRSPQLPPPTSLAAALPAPLTSFVGRERELAKVRRLLAGARLVTLTGPPGVGKTRFALALAADPPPACADGAAVVPLTPITEPGLVVAAIVQALGVRETPGRPPADALRAYLRPRRLLLVLDNFEQVLAAAPVVVELLEQAPRLVVLVTSRAVLRVRGEHAFLLPPLTLPGEGPVDLGAVLRSEAGRLFLARAQEAAPGVTPAPEQAPLVAAICRRLDGLPLALELAATRVRLLPLPALLARLERQLPVLTGGPRDLPARQQTLRAAIAWSHDLLAPPERDLFRRLAVFAGGFSLDAAGVVGALDADPGAAPPDALVVLAEHSLVQRLEGPTGDEPRFGMLEAIREYAQECLDASGEGPAAEERHAASFLALAEAAAPALLAGAPAERARELDRLAVESDNLRAALRRLLDRGDLARAVRLAVALNPWWVARQRWTEGRIWWDRIVAAGGPALDDRSRAEALTRAAVLALNQGELRAVRTLLGEALPLLRALGEPLPLARALLLLAAALSRSRDPEARPLAAEASALARALGSEQLLGAVLNLHAFLATFGGDAAAGHALAMEALALARRSGQRSGELEALHQLGNAAFLAGDLAAARARLEECRAVSRELGLPHDQTLIRLGEVAAREGDGATAAAHFAEALAHARAAGELDSEAWALQALGLLARTRGEEASATAHFRAALTLRRRQGHPFGVLVVLYQLAASAARRGQAMRAARLFAAAEARWADQPLLAADFDGGWVEAAVGAVRAALGEAAFAAAWATGKALTMEQAVAEALRQSDDGADAQACAADDGPPARP